MLVTYGHKNQIFFFYTIMYTPKKSYPTAGLGCRGEENWTFAYLILSNLCFVCFRLHEIITCFLVFQ